MENNQKKKHGCLSGCLTLIIAVFVIIGLIAACSGKDDSSDSTAKTSDNSSSVSTKSSLRDDNVPSEYSSALDKAEDYAATMDMSKQGIHDQLTSDSGEGFSEEATQYALKNLTDVNWNENALKKAEDYATTMDMSQQGVLEQLTSSSGEQFTTEQAQYAIDHLKNIDWNKNALNKAKSYQDDMDMSPEEIREQLTSSSGEQFTPDQAEYAVNHLK